MTSLPPDPTPQQALGYLPFSGGRITVAWSGLRRILLDVMPGVIAEANETFELDLPTPRNAFIAPEVLSDDALPAWVISSSLDFPLWGTGSELQSNTIIYLPYNSLLSPTDIRDSHELLDLLNATLFPFRGGHERNGLKLWDQLTPAPRTFLSGLPNWENARGFAQHFDLQQFPGENRWNPTE